MTWHYTNPCLPLPKSAWAACASHLATLMSVTLLCNRRSNPALLTRCWPSYCVGMLTCLHCTRRQSLMHHWVKVVYRYCKS